VKTNTTVEIAGRLFPALWSCERSDLVQVITARPFVEEAHIPLENGWIVDITKWADGQNSLTLLPPSVDAQMRAFLAPVVLPPDCLFVSSIAEQDIPALLERWSRLPMPDELRREVPS
jgi:hypothetical protein